jgi:ABC-type antimicrobial peptide transport system permease subunit
MRLYVPHDERRPQPQPAVTNDARAFLIGIGAWLIGLTIVLAIVVGILSAPVTFDPARALITIGVGLALGVIGLLVARRGRR